ncbi:protein WALLS ARE THIN 1-like [Amborella trichopoda]|uniref:protein WALLS ARE THIN 1-like n=1 Tax=Amborella trichopoda TaxID=13333 RepID=UPI0009BCCB66|nr:protein WALLS ARE THIN 1-like [Amborella trichopoda]|eukprot:XP_020524211.1 protein WALLS ARE THIN 1-like [Amborella trichopoda]
MGFSGQVRTAVATVLVQFLTVGVSILSQKALENGSNVFVIVAYRNLIAALRIAPYAYFKERISMGTSLFYYGLQCTSVTFAANVNNVIPVVTFIFAVSIRYSSPISPISIMDGYRESDISELALSKPLRRNNVIRDHTVWEVVESIWSLLDSCTGDIFWMDIQLAFNTVGGRDRLLIADMLYSLLGRTELFGSLAEIIIRLRWRRGSCLSLYALFIVQAKLLLIFPSKFTATALTCFMASIQSFVMGLERSFLVWRLHIDLQLLTIVYSAVTIVVVLNNTESRASVLRVYIDIHDAEDFSKTLNGFIIGSILIIGGLYAFLWGRKRSIINKGNNDKEICIQDSQEAVVVGASVPLQIIVAPLIDAEDEGREKQEIVKEKATR